MFTLARADYPLRRVEEAGQIYDHTFALCDGCHCRIPDLSHCYHSDTIFCERRGGFDLCEECHAGLRFHTGTAPRKPLPAINTRVKLVRLVRLPSLNEKLGRVVCHTDTDQRVGIRLDDGTADISVHVNNMLVQHHFLAIEDDVIRILAPPTATVQLDGTLLSRRVIPFNELQDTPEHTLEVDGVKYTFTSESCAICMTASDSLRCVPGHPVRICDTCATNIRHQPCPWCRSTAGDHSARPTSLKLIRVPLATHDVRFFTKVASLSQRYEILASPFQIEVKVKYMDLGDSGFRDGGGATRSMHDSCAAAVTGDGSSVTIRPPISWTVDVAQSHVDEMMFDKIVEYDSILYRLSDQDGLRKSSNFLDGRSALKCARFKLPEERVGFAIRVIDADGGQHSIYMFFSVNVRLPGIVVVMPDPDGEVAKQCVSIIDFYDPRFWRSEHQAVNHNDIDSFTRAYGISHTMSSHAVSGPRHLPAT